MEALTLFTVYITAHTLVGGVAGDGFDEALKRLTEARANAVVLESYRGGLSVDEETLRAARDRFQAAGFETLGGLMPVWGDGFGKRQEGLEMRLPFFCYTSEETVAALEGEIRKLARVFDQVVIDDAFLTSCRCADCDARREGQDWYGFRRDLLSAVGERWAKAAHGENPEVGFTVKFPQYYDRLHRFGYDAERFPRIFDKVWIGSETRDPDTPKYGYTEPYQGYFNIRWMTACAGDKFEAAWFDFIECDRDLFYQQAVSTFLGAPERVVLFCYGDALFDVVPPVAADLGRLEGLRRNATNPRGVHVLKPANSEGGDDLFIFDSLGMMGIPCVPVTRLDPAMRSVIVPGHGADDPDTARVARAIIENGGQVILTHQALRRFSDQPELLAAFGYTPLGIGDNRVDVRGIQAGSERFELEAPFRVAGDLEPEAGVEVPVTAVFGSWGEGDRGVPLVTVKAHENGGRGVVWNVSTFNHGAYTIEEHLCVPVRVDLMQLPPAVIGVLRHGATAPLGFRLDAPPRVSFYLFDGHAVIYNHRDEAVEVRVEGLLEESVPLAPREWKQLEVR